MNKVCAVIPAYNEGKRLAFVLKKIKEHNVDAIVVDDGSTDKSASIAESAGASVVRHAFNKGKGSALRDGFRLALESGYDMVITLDADGQHDTDMIPVFIDRIGRNGSDIIIGDRLHRPDGMPLYRLFVNRVFSSITSLVCGQNVPDAACGYRIISSDILRSIKLESNKFDIDPEIIIKSAKAGFRIGALKIKCIYDGETSYIRPMKYCSDFFRLMLKELKDR